MLLRCWVAVCRIFLLNYVNGYSCFRGYIVKIRTLNNFLIHENFSFIHSHRIKLNANVLFCLSYLTKYKDEVCMNQTSIILNGNPRKDHLLQCAQHTHSNLPHFELHAKNELGFVDGQNYIRRLKNIFHHHCYSQTNL